MPGPILQLSHVCWHFMYAATRTRCSALRFSGKALMAWHPLQGQVLAPLKAQVQEQEDKKAQVTQDAAQCLA